MNDSQNKVTTSISLILSEEFFFSFHQITLLASITYLNSFNMEEFYARGIVLVTFFFLEQKKCKKENNRKGKIHFGMGGNVV